MYTFTNHFSGPTLKQRIGMINSPESSSLTWWRYILWGLLMLVMGFACRHDKDASRFPLHGFATDGTDTQNLTQAIMLSLEDQGIWYRHLALLTNSPNTDIYKSTPVIIQLKNGKLHLADDYLYETALLINGQEAPLKTLETLSPEHISDLVVMHLFKNRATASSRDKPYQLLIQTSSALIPLNPNRRDFFTFLEAAGQSKYPLGETFSFNMNQLLEATFFHNKNALVERTPNEHLRIYEEYANITSVVIDGKAATVDDVKKIHVREVGRLHTHERPYTDWFRPNAPLTRFELFIQTAPERAKRDSSYYVFSPFYSGDF